MIPRSGSARTGAESWERALTVPRSGAGRSRDIGA